MATIRQRKRRDGTVSWFAEVRIKRDGAIIHREARTFDRRQAAESWARRLELELEKPGAAQARRSGRMSVSGALQTYRDEVSASKPFGKNKAAVIEALIASALGQRSLNDLAARDVYNHAQARRLAGAGPVTINIDLSYLGTALRWMRSIHQVGPGDTPLGDARPMLNQAGLIGKSNERDRRLESGEFEALTRFFDNRFGSQGVEIPMQRIVRFAVATAMRLGEICRIRWEDVNEYRRTVVIRDRKDPREKMGNDQEVPLLGEAWNIVSELEREADLIFPFNPRSISAAFSRATDRLGLVDLTFHDLRHEGICRLFEQGYAIQEVALVSGHKNWKTLQRYTHLRPEHLHRDALRPTLPDYVSPEPLTAEELAEAGLDIARGRVQSRVSSGVPPLVAWREVSGLEQRQLAEKAGISLSRYFALERGVEGRSEMRVSELVSLAKALGVGVEDILPIC